MDWNPDGRHPLGPKQQQTHQDAVDGASENDAPRAHTEALKRAASAVRVARMLLPVAERAARACLMCSTDSLRLRTYGRVCRGSACECGRERGRPGRAGGRRSVAIWLPSPTKLAQFSARPITYSRMPCLNHRNATQTGRNPARPRTPMAHSWDSGLQCLASAHNLRSCLLGVSE